MNSTQHLPIIVRLNVIIVTSDHLNDKKCNICLESDPLIEKMDIWHHLPIRDLRKSKYSLFIENVAFLLKMLERPILLILTPQTAPGGSQLTPNWAQTDPQLGPQSARTYTQNGNPDPQKPREPCFRERQGRKVKKWLFCRSGAVRICPKTRFHGYRPVLKQPYPPIWPLLSTFGQFWGVWDLIWRYFWP